MPPTNGSRYTHLTWQERLERVRVATTHADDPDVAPEDPEVREALAAVERASHELADATRRLGEVLAAKGLA